MSLHEPANESHLNKFAIFCAANSNMPYAYKLMVFNAAMTSSLLYSTETWLTKHPKKLIAQYNRALKCLLGVRKFTSPELCMIESGIPPVLDVIAKRRRKFIEDKLQQQSQEEPFHVVCEWCREANTPGYRFLTEALRYNTNVNPIDKLINTVRGKPPTASKYVTYRSVINPTLSVHPVYHSKKHIQDYMRQALTRLRLMSHNLKIETGRRNGIPAEQRLCICSANTVQDEAHVLLQCEISIPCRSRYSMLNFSQV